MATTTTILLTKAQMMITAMEIMGTCWMNWQLWKFFLYILFKMDNKFFARQKCKCLKHGSGRYQWKRLGLGDLCLAKNIVSDYKFKKVQESQAEFAEQKFRSLEEKYLKEMAELKVFSYKKIYTQLIICPIFMSRWKTSSWQRKIKLWRNRSEMKGGRDKSAINHTFGK
jgi:hypothetical protein